MKKYFMLVLTVFIIACTMAVYAYQNVKLPEVNYKYPKINIPNTKFGTIKNIYWSPFENFNHIFIVSTGFESYFNMDHIFVLDLKTGESNEVYKFEANKDHQDFLQFQYASNKIYALSSNGIIALDIIYNGDTRLEGMNESFTSIPDFQDINGIYIGNYIYYTKKNSGLLYVSSFPQSYPLMPMQSVNQNPIKTYLLNINKPSIVGTINGLVYTKLERNGLNVYETNFQNSISGLNEKLISKNAAELIGGIIFYGKYLVLTDDGKGYGVQMEGKRIYELPKYTDKFGQMPDIQLGSSSQSDMFAFTKYNEKNLGSLYLGENMENAACILKNAPIVGSVRLNSFGNKVLFTTVENGKTLLKYYDKNTDKTYDVSRFIY